MSLLIAKRYNGRQSCPHCTGPAKIRSSRAVSPTYREVTLKCDGDPECGWAGVASFIIERTTRESGIPRRGVSLPLTAPRRQPSGLPMPANDVGMAPAVAL